MSYESLTEKKEENRLAWIRWEIVQFRFVCALSAGDKRKRVLFRDLFWLGGRKSFKDCSKCIWELYLKLFNERLMIRRTSTVDKQSHWDGSTMDENELSAPTDDDSEVSTFILLKNSRAGVRVFTPMIFLSINQIFWFWPE